MSTSLACARCGARLGPDELCPRCELSLALLIPPPIAPLDNESLQPSLKRFGDYELIEELGHGGMGVVYKARQTKLNRIVALKLLLLGQFASEKSIYRFEREAQAAAALRHPNLVAVYDVGQFEGQHFLVMEYVEGRSLASMLREGPLSSRQTASYGRVIAEAISVAHGAGIIHRDLKPSNIIIDLFNQPRITDFGLAKRLSEAESTPGGPAVRNLSILDSELTVTGQVLGSPNYLAPELAAGKLDQAGPASDLFSIGAILYECLTGRPPFIAATLQETLLRIRDTEPVAPRALNPAVPRDLETICLKCLEKQVSKRYRTAEELGLELSRFLRSEPVRARPIGPAGRLWRWCQRKPAIALLLLLLHVAFALGLAGVLWGWRRSELSASNEARERRRSEAGELAARQRQYVSDMNLVQQVWEEGDLQRAQSLLRAHQPQRGFPDLRGFEWRYLFRLCQDESRLTLTNSGAEEVWSLASSPSFPFVVARGGNLVRLLDSATGRVLDRFVDQNPLRSIWSSACSSASPNIVATGDTNGVVCLWDFETKTVLGCVRGHSKTVLGLAYSPDSRYLASTDAGETGGGTLKLWNLLDLRSGGPRALWTNRLEHYCSWLLFSQDSKTLVSAGKEEKDGRMAVWDVESGRELPGFPKGHIGYVTCAAFSPDGKWLAVSGLQPAILIWDFATRRVVARLSGHIGPVTSLAFFSDGHRLVSGGEDKTVRIWDVQTGKQAVMLRGHDAAIQSVAIAPDQQTIFSTSVNQVKLWSVSGHGRSGVLETEQSWPCATMSPDGKWLVTSEYQRENSIKVWNLTSMQFKGNLFTISEPVVGCWFSPDGHFVAAGSEDRNVYVFDTAHLEQLSAPTKPVAILTNLFECTGPCFTPDGKILAVTGTLFAPTHEPSHELNRLAFWQVGTWKKLDIFPQAGAVSSEESVITTVGFSNDGQTMATGYKDGWVRLWDFQNGKLLSQLHEHRAGGYYVGVSFSSDGRWLLTLGLADSKLALYDFHDHRHPLLVSSWEGAQSGSLWAAGFDPSNRTVITSGNDGRIRFWNLATREMALTLKHGDGPGGLFSFSADRNVLYSWDARGTIRLWPASSLPDSTP